MVDYKANNSPSVSSGQPAVTLGRRKVISSLGIAAGTLAFAPATVSAAWFGRAKDGVPMVKVNSGANRATKSPSSNIGGFPEEWVRLQGRNLNAYAHYINSLKLRNISAQQIISAHAKKRGTCWNTLPPKQWWKRMGYTLRVVDRVAGTMNVPVESIISAYRSPEYNSRCAGAKRRSWHQANVAVDVKFDTSAWNVTQAARSLRDRGLFKGGVGSYSSFTHIDTRGQNVNW